MPSRRLFSILSNQDWLETLSKPWIKAESVIELIPADVNKLWCEWEVILFGWTPNFFAFDRMNCGLLLSAIPCCNNAQRVNDHFQEAEYRVANLPRFGAFCNNAAVASKKQVWRERRRALRFSCPISARITQRGNWKLLKLTIFLSPYQRCAGRGLVRLSMHYD